MRLAFQTLLAAVLVLGATAGTRAQPPAAFSKTNVFAFAPITLPGVKGDEAETKLGAKAALKVRPNATTELYTWVFNPTEEKDFIVEVTGPKGVFTMRTKVTIPRDTWVRVRLPKPAPPAPAPAAPPAPPAAADPKAPPVVAAEPPPGAELVAARSRDIRLTFRLLDKNGEPLKDDGGLPYGGSFPVEVLSPADYVKLDGTVTAGKGTLGVQMTVTPDSGFQAPGSGSAQLLIPARAGAVVRDGVYRRPLTLGPKAPPVVLTGKVEGAREQVRMYVGVDGIDRAFPFKLDPLGTTPATQLLPERQTAVRASLATTAALEATTQPVARFPVRVEVDSPAAGDTLEIHVQPAGAPKTAAEVVKLDGTREVRVWLDPAGPTDGGLLFTTKSTDWVVPLDLANVRGKVSVTAVLETATGPINSDPITVTVDGTPPEEGAILLPLPATLEKGKPLTVTATARDPETAVTKATFYLFRQYEDGKIPAAAVKGEGFRSPQDAAVWTADLKVPDEFRGPGLVAVVFGNSVGLTSEPADQKITIEDPKPKKPAAGTITGKVVFGERPQPGVAVSLRDADNKEKAAGTTDDNGKFKFENVAPGVYTLVAEKKDSSTGASGTAPVQVEADKVAKPVVTLAKNRK